MFVNQITGQTASINQSDCPCTVFSVHKMSKCQVGSGTSSAKPISLSLQGRVHTRGLKDQLGARSTPSGCPCTLWGPFFYMNIPAGGPGSTHLAIPAQVWVHVPGIQNWFVASVGRIPTSTIHCETAVGSRVSFSCPTPFPKAKLPDRVRKQGWGRPRHVSP